MKTVLIIDKEEEAFKDLMSIFTEFGEKINQEKSLAFLNEKSLTLIESKKLIQEYRPDIILIGHVLRGIFKECVPCKSKYGEGVKYEKCPSCNADGLQALNLLNPLPSGVKVISMSSFAFNSNELASKYRQIGVSHFSGRDYRKMISCIFDECNCKSFKKF